MEEQDQVLQQLLTLMEDYHDFNPRTTQVYQEEPTPTQFCKQVSKGLPCIYPAPNLIKDYKANSWTRSHMIQAVKGKVEVAVTPNGRADSISVITDQANEEAFFEPANLNMTLEDLFNKLDGPVDDSDPVYYLQSQNGNLTSTPLAPLFEDLPENFAFAQDVLGEPEAVNIWIGDERSVTSAHRDPYENLYVVLRGSKVFTLWPPIDEVTLDTKTFVTGRLTFDEQSSTFGKVLNRNDEVPSSGPPKIPWVTVDPAISREELNSKHPLYKFAQPQTIAVEEGQMLYLPSGWYHHVAQRCGIWHDGSKAPCISVNYWYDQDYEGEKYVMRQLVSRLTQQVQQSQP